MKFVLDENIPLSLVDLFLACGFLVEHIRLTPLRGAEDKEISHYAKQEQAILITKDLEFANILLYPPGSHYGLVVLRLPYYYTAQQISEVMKRFLSEIKLEELSESITVIELGRYRIRKHPNSGRS